MDRLPEFGGLPEADRPHPPEDPHLLHEEERLSLLFMLSMDEERQQTDAPLTWLQELEFLTNFVAASPEGARPAMRNHVRVMIMHTLDYLMRTCRESIEKSNYEKMRAQICQKVLKGLKDTPILTPEDLEHSALWRLAFDDLMRHVGNPQGNDLL